MAALFSLFSAASSTFTTTTMGKGGTEADVSYLKTCDYLSRRQNSSLGDRYTSPHGRRHATKPFFVYSGRHAFLYRTARVFMGRKKRQIHVAHNTTK